MRLFAGGPTGASARERHALVPAGSAAISKDAAAALGHDSSTGARPMLQLANGSDSVLACAVDAALPPGSIALCQAQAYNLRTAAGERERFVRFEPLEAEQPWGLAELEAEVSLLGRGPEDGARVELDAAALEASAARQLLGQVVALGEAVVVPLAGGRVLLRVAATENLDPGTAAEAIGHHCFRGLVTLDTRIWLSESPDVAAAAGSGGPGTGAPQSLLSGRARVRLLSARPRPPPGASIHLLNVLTNDGEVFPVHRRLLRPCIALTRALRDEAARQAAVDVSTSAFDRVLLFLEALALRRQPPAWGVHLLPELAEAAARLGLRPLQVGRARQGISTADARSSGVAVGSCRVWCARAAAAGACRCVPGTRTLGRCCQEQRSRGLLNRWACLNCSAGALRVAAERHRGTAPNLLV